MRFLDNLLFCELNVERFRPYQFIIILLVQIVLTIEKWPLFFELQTLNFELEKQVCLHFADVDHTDSFGFTAFVGE